MEVFKPKLICIIDEREFSDKKNIFQQLPESPKFRVGIYYPFSTVTTPLPLSGG